MMLSLLILSHFAKKVNSQIIDLTISACVAQDKDFTLYLVHYPRQFNFLNTKIIQFIIKFVKLL